MAETGTAAVPEAVATADAVGCTCVNVCVADAIYVADPLTARSLSQKGFAREFGCGGFGGFHPQNAFGNQYASLVRTRVGGCM